MADAAVSVLVRDVLARLASNSIKEIGLLWGLTDEILTLKNVIDKIEAVVHDAEEKRSTDTEVDSWLKNLKSASLMVENVLDEISTEAMLQRLHKKRGRGTKYWVRAFFTHKLTFRVRVRHTVKNIRRTVDAVASKISELKLTPLEATSHVDVDHVDVIGDMSDGETSLVIGREKDMVIVIETICNKDIGKLGNGEVRVFCIWGMEGVGKTILARLVYNHVRVKNYFELKCWVCVSEKFQVKEKIKELIECIDKCECTLTHLDVLQESLQNKLKGKKFLIVLDDVWDDEAAKPKWDLLIQTLSCGAEESVVLMTTQSKTFSQMMAKVPELQHEMKLLSGAAAWLLYYNKQKALVKRRERESKRPKESSKLTSEEAKLLDALKLSYNNLLPHEKQCFAYCSLFPKDYDMEKEVVIQLWVVNGFIPPNRDIDLYVLGEETFNSLVSKSFFQAVEGKKYLNVRFKIHYLIEYMEQKVMGDDCFIIKQGSTDAIIPNEALHLSSSCPDIPFSPQELGMSTSLRSIFMFGEGYTFSISQNFNHVHLRVLYLCGVRLKTLPKSICKLKYLKYLNLSYSSIEVLPESIVYLQNLQVLLLNFCYELHTLPEDLRYMISLQILDITSCPSLQHLPPGIKELTNLRRLPRFHVGNKKGAKIRELGNLDRLEGELEISGLENVGSFDEVDNANLIGKSNLSILKLSWSNISMRESKREMFEYDMKVLEHLQPNSSLKELSIYFYMGKEISPSWMVELENLVEIVFSGCKHCEGIPSLGTLLNLRVIKLLGMDSLESFNEKDMLEHNNMFRSLKELNIFMCPSLVSLPRSIFNLEILRLEECGALSSLPAEFFVGLKEVEISGCKHLTRRYGDWLKASHFTQYQN